MLESLKSEPYSVRATYKLLKVYPADYIKPKNRKIFIIGSEIYCQLHGCYPGSLV